jgi:FixJ family two-component response regulator
MSDATVFIVDDDQAVARSLRWLIETVRLQVETFASAQAFSTATMPRSRAAWCSTCACPA